MTTRKGNQVTGLEYVQEFVKFLFPGTMFAEENVRRISAAARMTNDPGEIPRGCFGYQYFTRVVTELSNGKEHLDDAYDFSCRYYFGTKYSYDDIARLNELHGDDRHQILLTNMECNKWDYVVQTRHGNFQPVQDGDVVYER